MLSELLGNDGTEYPFVYVVLGSIHLAYTLIMTEHGTTYSIRAVQIWGKQDVACGYT